MTPAQREARWRLHLRVAIEAAIDPDDARTRCSFVPAHFPAVTWSIPQGTERSARWDWPTDIWSRQPGRDDVLLHPAVRAVMIFCVATES